MDLAGWLQRCPIIAILRGVKPEEVESICTVLEESGVSIVEVPLNSPDALKSIEILSRIFGERMLVGAGTVTSPKQVDEVAAAGGELIVMPHADLEVVRTAKSKGLFVTPGFFTPTEAFALLDAGADAIKLFPSEVLGIPMMKALLAVLPASANIIAVGGMNAENIAHWIEAGAAGVGIGTSIYKSGDDADVVRQKTQSLMAALQ